ncbi:MAG: GNAT family N-acetyltransferase [Acidimicrobiales bacterium]
MADSIRIRKALPDELDAVVALAGRALGWNPAEPNRTLFEWKHSANPFGPSRLWVAVDADQIVGIRALMRWEFRRPDSRVARAVRPVDTATDPDHQGRGIFRRLTEHAIEAEAADGVSFVFNTPNDQSRPGYLKMGWQEVGQVATWVRPHSLPALARMARSREPAQKWSLPTDAGDDPVTVFTDQFVDHLATDPDQAMTTNRSGSFLRWRYGLPELHYRVITTDDAAVVFRLRRRGVATELVLADVLAVAPAAVTDALKKVRRAVSADYEIAAGSSVPGLLRLPGQGPVLTTRRLAEAAPGLDDFALRLGDIELF